MKLQSEFSRDLLKTIFARLPPLASADRCGPHPLATPLCRDTEVRHAVHAVRLTFKPNGPSGCTAVELKVYCGCVLRIQCYNGLRFKCLFNRLLYFFALI